ncbi:TPA: hypothetical protein N2D99_002301 [Clostridium botulinum]|nr:hypothetical protein [Clostridium botulinum]
MFKIITDGEELRGKNIKYCNLSHGVDCDEHNIICTEDNEIMFFNISEDNRIICYNEQQTKSCICVWEHIANEFIQKNIITEDELNNFKMEIKERKELRDEKIKQQRYEEYLKLKQEFE